MPTYEYKCEDCGIIEIFHSMSTESKTVCPECGKQGLERLISGGGAFIMKGKEANQYNDILKAKYWRDKDGNRHKVTPADGSSNSPTVSSKRKRTDAEVAAIKKRGRQLAKKQRSEESYRRYANRMKKP